IPLLSTNNFFFLAFRQRPSAVSILSGRSRLRLARHLYLLLANKNPRGLAFFIFRDAPIFYRRSQSITTITFGLNWLLRIALTSAASTLRFGIVLAASPKHCWTSQQWHPKF